MSDGGARPSASEWVIGLDLGGTDLKYARVHADGALEGFRRTASRTGESAEAPLAVLTESIRALAGEQRPRAVGLGCPGVIDPRTGALVGETAHLPHWRDLALAQVLGERTGCVVAVDNDANCAALAEARVGGGRGGSVVLMITLGTGIGAGLVVNGRVHRGAHGGAGEIGHIPIGDGRLACRCGVPNCVEPEASGSGLSRQARDAGLGELDAAEVFALAARGESRAQAMIERFSDRLGAVIAIAVQVVDPDIVVIGGGVAQAGDPLLAGVRASFEHHVLASHRRRTRIVPAALGERAGVVGAGLLAWDHLQAM
jgi:glucokinase